MSDTLNTAMTDTFEIFSTDVITQAWKAWDLDAQKEFRNRLAAFVTAANMLREEFDGAVWSGKSDGSVSAELESIRRPRGASEPGEPKRPLTAAEKLAKKLAGK